MKFKNYPRRYEKVFSDENLNIKKCSLDKVSVYENEPGIEAVYRDYWRKTLDSFYGSIFDHLVKVAWLVRRFCYRGYRRRRSNLNGVELDRAFGVYIRNFVGYDNRFFMRTQLFFPKVMSYLDDFYPNFDQLNPFIVKLEYPYQHMTLDCLITVANMPERMSLLAQGEAEKMTYMEFMDYIINYVNCYNEDNGETYIFVLSHRVMPYVKKI